MTARSRLAPLVAKELRELGPLWLVMLAGILAARLVIRWTPVDPIAVAFYVLGALALGAMAIGHEFRHRTMATLLAQPIGRVRLLAAKMVVLAVLLGALAAAPWAGGTDMPPAEWLIPLGCGLLLAPWFTILCRSELAGMVFAAAVPALLVLGTTLVALLTYGAAPDRLEEARRLEGAIINRGLLIAFAIAAFWTVRSFLRLEVAGRRRFETWWPARHHATAASNDRTERRIHHPYWALVRKELALQRLPLCLAGLFVLCWLVGLATGGGLSDRLDVEALASGLSGFYAIVIALLVGSIASAEERNMGTLPFQVLQPIAAWKQWATKALVVVGLATLFASLPNLLTVLATGQRLMWWSPFAPMPPMLALLSLYVSSLNTSAIRAFLMAVGVVAASAFLVMLLPWPLQPMTSGLEVWRVAAAGSTAETIDAIRWLVLASLAARAVLVLLLVRFAMVNHRTLDRAGSIVARQLAWLLVAVLALASTQAAAFNRFVQEQTRQRATHQSNIERQ